MKVVMCGKFRVGVAAFDWWLWMKSLFVLRKLICSGYEGTCWFAVDWWLTWL